jgi:hypothetical protein
MEQNSNNETTRKNLVHHFSDELLLDAWDGLKRRFGPRIEDFSLNEHKLLKLVENSREINGTITDNYLWAKEIIDEMKIRLADGRIKLTIEEGA